MNFKQGKLLDKHMSRIGDPTARMRAELGLRAEQRQWLDNYRSGRALRERNAAVRDFGHGRIYSDDMSEYRDIGGSTGGLTRQYMGVAPSPHAHAWIRRG